jgi:hypothetical protein
MACVYQCQGQFCIVPVTFGADWGFREEKRAIVAKEVFNDVGVLRAAKATACTGRWHQGNGRRTKVERMSSWSRQQR